MIAQHFNVENRRQAGDTLVEVLLATVILSIVVTASYVLVNRASRINQLSSERSEAVNIMQTQAETLRLYRERNNNAPDPNSVWNRIIRDNVADTAPVDNNCAAFMNDSSGGTILGDLNPFYFSNDISFSKLGFAPTLPNGNFERYYVWIDGYDKSDSANDDYVDFFVHACWMGPGGTGPQRSSLVYRLAK